MPKQPSDLDAILADVAAVDAERERERKCLTADCRSDKAAGLRGLCMKCYSRAKKLVAGGATTWEELAQLGMVESKDKDPFETEFLKRKSGN